MKSKKPDVPDVLYQGRWMSREHFRTFVYGTKGKKLASSYDEYEALINSGEWFANKEDVPAISEQKGSARKVKDGANS